VTLADGNVLIYAFRVGAPHHDVCKRWLANLVAGNERFGVSPLALSALVRISTDARIYDHPSPLSEAFDFCNVLLAQPNCDVIEPGRLHWTIFERLCVQTGITGRRMTDAWFAALAVEHGCTWISFDRDFARFPGLDWREPEA